MKWFRISDYAIRSDCARYRICKVMVKGEAIFELWAGRERIGDWPTAQEAKDEASTRGGDRAAGNYRRAGEH